MACDTVAVIVAVGCPFEPVTPVILGDQPAREVIDITILDASGVQQLAQLPSLDELRAKFLGLLNAPATKVAGVLQAPAGQLARVMQAYADKAEAA